MGFVGNNTGKTLGPRGEGNMLREKADRSVMHQAEVRLHRPQLESTVSPQESRCAISTTVLKITTPILNYLFALVVPLDPFNAKDLK